MDGGRPDQPVKRRSRRRAVGPLGSAAPDGGGVAPWADEGDPARGEDAEPDEDEDERLLREVPPHFGS